MHLSITLITAAMAVIADANPLEKRQFFTCDTKNQGIGAATLSIADSLAQTDGVITITHDEIILAQRLTMESLQPYRPSPTTKTPRVQPMQRLIASSPILQMMHARFSASCI